MQYKIKCLKEKKRAPLNKNISFEVRRTDKIKVKQIILLL